MAWPRGPASPPHPKGTPTQAGEGDPGRIATRIRLTVAWQSVRAIMRIEVTVGMLTPGLLPTTACGSAADEAERGTDGIRPATPRPLAVPAPGIRLSL
jgi:hypothetical protein